MHRTDLTAAVSLVLSAHTSSTYAAVATNPRSAFSIDIVPAPAKHVKAREPDTSTDQYGSEVAVPNEALTGFYSPIMIGDQTFQMILDTGSADL